MPINSASFPASAGFGDRVLAIPDPVKWAMALFAVAAGLLIVLRTESVVRGMRRWLVVQLKWLRSPGYRRLAKVYGWVLFLTGMALIAILAARGGA